MHLGSTCMHKYLAAFPRPSIRHSTLPSDGQEINSKSLRNAKNTCGV